MAPMTPTPGRQAMLLRSGKIVASAVAGLDPNNPAVIEGLELAITKLSQTDRTLLDALEVLPLNRVQVQLNPFDTHDDMRDKIAVQVMRAIADELHKVAQTKVTDLVRSVNDHSPPKAPTASFFAKLGHGLKKAGALTAGTFVSPLTTAWRSTGGVATMPMPGDTVKGMARASAEVTDAAARDLTTVAAAFNPTDLGPVGSKEMRKEMERLENRLGAVAPKYGVRLNVAKAWLPQVDWGPFPTVKVGKGKGFPHEMIHAFQLTLGGAAALGTRSTEKLVASGQERPGLDQVLAGIKDLNHDEVKEAYARHLGPAESQGYALYEAGAGLAGPGGGAASPAAYRDALLQNIKAFAGYFKTAQAPQVPITTKLAAYAAIGKAFPGFDKFGQAALSTGALAFAFLGGAAVLPTIAFAIGGAMGAAALIGGVRGFRAASASKRALT